MNLSKIVKSVAVGLPFAATVAAAPTTQAAVALNTNVVAAVGAPTTGFSGGTSSFTNWHITPLGAVANIDAERRFWIVPLNTTTIISEQSVSQVSATAFCSSGSTAQLVTTDLQGNVLSANLANLCITGQVTQLGVDLVTPHTFFLAYVRFSLKENGGNAHWASIAVQLLEPEPPDRPPE